MKTVRLLFLLANLFVFYGSTAVADDLVKVGVIAADLAPFKNGAVLIRETRKRIDQRVAIYYHEVDTTSSSQILEAYHQLTQAEKVDMLLSGGGEIAALLTPLAESEQQHLFLLDSNIRQVEGRKYVTLFANEAGEFGRAIWDQFRVEKRKKMAVIKGRATIQNQIIDSLVNNTIGEESVIVVQEPAKNVSAYQSLIKRLKGEGIESVGLFISDDAERLFFAEAQKAGLSSAAFKIGEYNYLESDSPLAIYPSQTLFLTPFVGDSYRQRYREHFSSLKGVEIAARFDDFLNLVADIPLESFPFDDERLGASGPYCVKTTSRKGSYYSFPLAIYKVSEGTFIKQRYFERPS